MKKKKGFSLIELLIVLAILGVVLTIATMFWQRYVAKINLKSGAGQIASDLSKYRAKAIAEGRAYTITFGATDHYNVSAPAQDTFAAFNVDAAPIEAARSQDAQITASNFTGCDVVRMTSRGLVEHCSISPANPSDTGTITLQNSRGATAIITINSRGTVDVTFSNS